MATSKEDKENFLDLCQNGNIDGVTQLLTQDPTLIKYKDEEKGEVNKKNKDDNIHKKQSVKIVYGYREKIYY